MQRKVIKQGHNTLTITLPTKWAEKNSIKPGNELFIEEKGNSLTISSKNTVTEEKTSIDVTEFDVALEKVIYSLYKKGYDEIEILSANPALLNNVQKIILEIVVGFEVVSTSKNACIIKSVVEVNKEEFSSIVRRIFLHLHTMEDGIYNSIINKDIEGLKTFRQMEILNNRYTGFCRRLINRGQLPDDKNQKLIYCFIEFLEKIPDEYKFLCDYLIAHNAELKKISKTNLRIMSRIIEFSRNTEHLYYKYSIKDYLRLYRQRKELVKQLNEIFERQKEINIIFTHYMLNLIQFYVDITNFILTMNL